MIGDIIASVIDMISEISDVLIKAGSKEEKKYCKKYNIELDRLKNGITIFGVPCAKDFTSWARISWSFLDGAYGNVPGAVHFLEHFFNKKITTIAEQNSLYFNAYTSQIEVSEEISGVSNYKIKNYGIWKALKEVRKSLEFPLNTVKNIQSRIESERKVIKAEIRRAEADHDYQVGKHFRNFVFSVENPLRDIPSVLGTEEDLDRLDLSVLKEIQEKVLISQNMFIDFYTEGDLSIASHITKELKKLFTDFPRTDKSKNILDRKLLRELSLDLKPGINHLYDHQLKNRIISYEFIWVFKHKFVSGEYFALKLLKGLIWHQLHDYSRKKGWGYRTDVGLNTQADDVQILIVRVDVRKGSEMNLLPGIKKVMDLTRKRVRFLVEKEKKRQLATPMSLTDRASWIEEGLEEFDSIIDADKIRMAMLQLTTKEYYKVIDSILSIEPSILVTGDLS